MDTYLHKTMVSVASLEKIEIIRSQEFMPSKARLKFLKKMIILGHKTAILGPQFCRILVLGPHFWWSGGASPWGPPWIRPWVVCHKSGILVIFWNKIIQCKRNLNSKIKFWKFYLLDLKGGGSAQGLTHSAWFNYIIVYFNGLLPEDFL